MRNMLLNLFFFPKCTLQVVQEAEPPLSKYYRHISKGAWPFSSRRVTKHWVHGFACLCTLLLSVSCAGCQKHQASAFSTVHRAV
jgi:hypothetical protein